MESDTLENWAKIKAHFETLPEHKRDNMFYRRAVAICSAQPDPLADVDLPIASSEGR